MRSTRGGDDYVHVSYKKLWKLLIDKDMTRAQLQSKAGISAGTMTKLRQSESVSMDVLFKICRCLKCNIGDIVEFEARDIEGGI